MARKSAAQVHGTRSGKTNDLASHLKNLKSAFSGFAWPNSLNTFKLERLPNRLDASGLPPAGDGGLTVEPVLGLSRLSLIFLLLDLALPYRGDDELLL